MTVKTAMIVILAFASAAVAQSNKGVGILPAMDHVRLEARYDGAKLKTSLHQGGVGMESFAGLVVASPWKKIEHVAGLPPLLGYFTVVGFGFTDSGRLDFSVPANPSMNLYIQGATLTGDLLQITPIQFLAGTAQADAIAVQADATVAPTRALPDATPADAVPPRVKPAPWLD
jgi:hypothetical protein